MGWLGWLSNSDDRSVRRVACTVVASSLVLFSGAPSEAVTLEEAYQAAESNNLSLQLLREQTFQAETLKGQALSILSNPLHHIRE